MYNWITSIVIFLSFIFCKGIDPISTGRPGSGNPTNALSKGIYQIEIGANFISAQGGNNKSRSFPMLVRMGLFNNIEWQVGYSNSLNLSFLYGGINLFDKLENSIIINSSSEIYDYVDTADVIGVDEAQFFDDKTR